MPRIPVSLLFQILVTMLLTPQFLKRLDPFYMRSKHMFRGKFRGERRSLNRGTGMEFADYRVYEPGDDLRHVDWNIYARLDRLFIKLFHTDEDLSLVLLIDNSRSMEFGSPTKLTCAKQIAAALGYIALAHADSVAVYTCAERLSPTLPPTTGKSQFPRLTKALNAMTASGQTRLTECLKQLPMYQRRAGVGVILSDFLDPNGYADGLKLLLGRGFSLTVIHLISPEEMAPQTHLENTPTGADWLVEDAETGETKAVTINAEILAQYRDQQQAFCNNMQRFCTDQSIGYAELKSDTPVEPFILQELHRIGLIQRHR
ncbi:MAG: DUF58 domain-containing protein [Candidatus Poribacteria bacterium]|nr:DUF58 domain-containing protein [Candidatus Poribacteria bacterium]